MVDLDLTLCRLKRQGTSDAQDIDASVPVTFKWVTLTTFALEGKDNPKFPLYVSDIISEMFLLLWVSTWLRRGGLARAGTRSTVTTCDEYPQPFVVLVVMVLILLCFST